MNRCAYFTAPSVTPLINLRWKNRKTTISGMITIIAPAISTGISMVFLFWKNIMPMGKVRSSSLLTKINGIRNSFHVQINNSRASVEIVGQMAGTKNPHRILMRGAPSITAASTNSLGTCWKALAIIRVVNGSDSATCGRIRAR
ncbi:Hypothetical Protein PANA_0322 [Pantoea ananatis LMG 20103]|uniref:Uncharacterized protein n=1 Tax=Pantoea ananatis (strain LMG 20103) TaxID=706191 RepID=D4GHH4_PANAM|nr:Hypothetical Protein PANA_0322 [Pantoea ananatis LMG 20103]